ncbi:MAG TPA: ABC transporter substrate-binding protein [Methanothrix sp.]|jgi:iron complex transport system substrate-binding protein|nr:ABC transporter substrate-binding protein [Methanothrix sp.]
MRMMCGLVLFFCFFNLLGLAAAYQAVTVSGDTNGDKVISSEELKVAETDFKDGRISSEELEKIRLIHESYPRNIDDSTGNEITIYKPIERIAVLTTEDYEILRTLNSTDKIVAASKYVVQSTEQGCGELYADGAGFVNIGSPVSSVDWEALIKSSPDLVITYMSSPKQEDLDQNLKDTNITVMRLDSGNISQYADIIDKMGYLLDRNDEAKKYNRFFEEKLGKYLNAVSGLSTSERPMVYLEADFGGGQTYYTCGSGHAHNALLVAAGGNNIFSELQGFKQVDPESVAVKNPEIILRYKYLKDSPGIDKDLSDTAALEALTDDMLGRTELNRTPAVKNKKVYLFTWDCTKGGGRFYLGMGYLGKWLQPEIFQDYSPREAYQEYLKEFQNADVDVVNKGVFVYPEA